MIALISKAVPLSHSLPGCYSSDSAMPLVWVDELPRSRRLVHCAIDEYEGKGKIDYWWSIKNSDGFWKKRAMSLEWVDELQRPLRLEAAASNDQPTVNQIQCVMCKMHDVMCQVNKATYLNQYFRSWYTNNVKNNTIWMKLLNVA